MIVSGFKCDVCGREDLKKYEDVPAIPEGWATFTMHYPPGLCDREDHVGHMCPGCARAMHDGVTLTGAYMYGRPTYPDHDIRPAHDIVLCSKGAEE